MAKLTGSGKMTFTQNTADEAELRLILQNMGDIDTRQEIKGAFSKASKDYKSEGKKTLTSHKFKYSRIQGGKKATGYRYNSPGRKTGNLIHSFSSSMRFKPTDTRLYVGFRKGKGGGNHAHLIDVGTNDRWTRAFTTKPYMDRLGRNYKKGRTYIKGHYTGSVSARMPKTGNQFWHKAVETQGPRQVENLNRAIDTALTRIIARR